MSDGDPWSGVIGEHAAIRGRLAELARPSRPPRSPSVRTFVRDVRRHLRREEAVLYPLCEELFGGPQGPVSVLRADHAVLARMLTEMLRKSERSDGDGLADQATKLGERFESHFLREERVLFPMLTARLPGAQIRALVERLHARATEAESGSRNSIFR